MLGREMLHYPLCWDMLVPKSGLKVSVFTHFLLCGKELVGTLKKNVMIGKESACLQN